MTTAIQSPPLIKMMVIGQELSKVELSLKDDDNDEQE